MDNASKALIMAGAILLAVAIVGIGIYIFSVANSTVNDTVSSMDSVQAAMFNARFDPYINKRISGAQVKMFFNEVISNNAINKDHVVRISARWVSNQEYRGHKIDAKEINGINKYIDDHSYYRLTPTTNCSITGAEDGVWPDGTYSCITIRKVD